MKAISEINHYQLKIILMNLKEIINDLKKSDTWKIQLTLCLVKTLIKSVQYIQRVMV